MEKLLGRVERALLGSPKHRARVTTLSLPKRRALPLLGADSLSSVAYAPDEIVLMLALAGAAGLVYTPWVAIGIAAVLLVVVGTYRYNISQIAEQGDYLLVHRRLGPVPAMVLGASSMVDFLLTVAVSVAAAAGYITAVFPALTPYNHWVAVILVLTVMLLCLRGWRFMGRVSQVPTYAFIVFIFLVITVGLIEAHNGTLRAAESSSYYVIPRSDTETFLTGFGLAMLLARAFSSGAVAISGVGTVNNSVKFFAQPKKQNAAQTLIMIGLASALMLVGVLYLVKQTGAKVVDEPERYLMINGALAPEGFQQKPLLYQVADAVFTGQTIPVLLSVATVGILMMASATAFIGFPVLTSRIAEHRYLPAHMSARSSANLYSNSVLLLATTAILLVAVFGSDVNSLIQLYIVGVFTSITLTQTAVAKHRAQQLRLTLEPIKRRRLLRDFAVTTLGLCATASSLVVVLLTKLTQGAWVTVLLILATVGIMLMVRKHYERIDSDLNLDTDSETALAEARRLPARIRALIYVPRVRKPVARAIAYARAARPSSIEAVVINVVEENTKQTIALWEKLGVPVPLTILDAPYRDAVRPLLNYVRTIKQESPRDVLVVYLPEYVVTHWWERIIHRRTVHRLAQALKHETGVVIASVPWNIGAETNTVIDELDNSQTRREPRDHCRDS